MQSHLSPCDMHRSLHVTVMCSLPQCDRPLRRGSLCGSAKRTLATGTLYLERAWNKGSFISLPQAIWSWPKRAQHSRLKLQCQMGLLCRWRLTFCFLPLISLGGGLVIVQKQRDATAIWHSFLSVWNDGLVCGSHWASKCPFSCARIYRDTYIYQILYIALYIQSLLIIHYVPRLSIKTYS